VWRNPPGRKRRWALGSLFALLIGLWSLMPPSNNRDWQPDVAVLPTGEIRGNQVTVRNVRNFRYRSTWEYDARAEDRTYDLDRIRSLDFYVVYWSSPSICHTMLSFGFEGDQYLCLSVEARKEKAEAYSAIKGFFRQYELYYVVADERDVIRLRTNYRNDPPEDVYVYRLQGPLENVRRVFLQYMNKINDLQIHPEFYNTLTTNCTTGIWLHTLVNPEHLPFSWKILASGYVPEYAYDAGRLDNRLPFSELKQRAHVNARAKAANGAADFSRLIREAPETAVTTPSTPQVTH